MHPRLYLWGECQQIFNVSNFGFLMFCQHSQCIWSVRYCLRELSLGCTLVCWWHQWRQQSQWHCPRTRQRHAFASLLRRHSGTTPLLLVVHFALFALACLTVSDLHHTHLEPCMWKYPGLFVWVQHAAKRLLCVRLWYVLCSSIQHGYGTLQDWLGRLHTHLKFLFT